MWTQLRELLADTADRKIVVVGDFMVDRYQVVEARAMDADCILLIMACLDNKLARELAECAHDLGMDVLCETHNEDEIKRAIDHVPYDLLGINNRNLKTFDTSLETFERLAPSAPKGAVLVAESGIGSPTDIQRLAKAGADAFLVGESLVRQPDPGAALAQLLGL